MSEGWRDEGDEREGGDAEGVSEEAGEFAGIAWLAERDRWRMRL